MTEFPTLQALQEWLRGAEIGSDGRLPPERNLCQTLGVTRTELRKALIVLEANGVVHRQVGRGTFLSRRDPSGHSRISDLSALAERTSPHDAMMARLALEPELAGLAAIHASPRQLSKARKLNGAMRAANSWEDYETLDAEFHATIAASARNSLLIELHRIVNAVRVSVVWARLDIPQGGPPPDYHSFNEHDAILAALDQRDKARAYQAMRTHLKSVRATFLPED